MASGRVAALGGVLVVGLLAAGGYAALHTGLGPLPDPEGCSARVAGHFVALSLDQAENASIIAAVAERRALPARAISIAIATAVQESTLENLNSGDLDSLGLFQQRPSQGWGSAAQVTDPYYATNAFYDALVQVDGYQTMAITKAAQAVQRSAFPDAYSAHEADGRTIASALSGYSPAAFTCVVNSEAPGQSGASKQRTQAVRADLRRAFGPVADPARAHGGALDVVFRPVNDASIRTGWVVAQYLVANAKRLHVSEVVFDRRIWSAGTRSTEGWRDYAPPGGSTTSTAAGGYRDRVLHVTVS